MKEIAIIRDDGALGAVAAVTAATEPAGTDVDGPGHEALAILEASGWTLSQRSTGSQTKISLDAKVMALQALDALPAVAPVAMSEQRRCHHPLLPHHHQTTATLWRCSSVG